MNAVILAGGAGTRLREVVRERPKPMAFVGERPFLEYVVVQLHHWGFRNIVLAVGYKGEMIEAHFNSGDRWGVRIKYSNEDRPLGTGGAVRESLRLIDSECFLLMNGDTFADLDLGELRTRHRMYGKAGTIGLVHRDDCSRYGRVETDESGNVVSFIEKGAAGAGWINCGVGIYQKPAILEMTPPGPCSLERDVLPRLIPDRLGAYLEDTFFVDIGLPDDYLSTRERPERLTVRRRDGR